MKVAVVGAGSVGRAVAKELATHRNTVVLIDNEPTAIRVAELPQAEWILADACSPSALEDAALESCDALVCATGDDKVNLVVSMLAKTEFHVPKVVARVNDPSNEWLFTSDWGVDIPTSTPRVMAALVEEAVTVGTAVQLSTLTRSGIGVYSLTVPEDSVMVGKVATDIHWPADLLIAGIARNRCPFTLEVAGVLEAGDEILAFAGPNHFLQIEELEQLIFQVS